MRLLGAIQQLASDKGVTPSQLALAWLLHQAPEVVPIPGTKRIPHLEENIAAINVQLSAEELSRINGNVPAPGGERYDPLGMRTVNI